MDAITANLPILAELLILVIAIVFAILQIRSVNRLQRERAANEARERGGADSAAPVKRDGAGDP
jgi:hypothetical protein